MSDFPFLFVPPSGLNDYEMDKLTSSFCSFTAVISGEIPLEESEDPILEAVGVKVLDEMLIYIDRLMGISYE